MVDYSDTVAKYVESRRSYDLASEAEIYGGDVDKVPASTKEIVNNLAEHRAKIAKSAQKVMKDNGPDLFNDYKAAEKKILQQCIEDGVYQKKGDYFQATIPNCGIYFEHNCDLVLTASAIAQNKGLEIADTLKKDELNAEGKHIARDFHDEFYSKKGGFEQAKYAMQFAQAYENSYHSNKFTKENIDLNAHASNETKDKSMLNENEFKTMLAERVRDMDKIKQYENDPNQRYYGHGLMASRDTVTDTISYSVDNQQVDKDAFLSLRLMYDNPKDDRLDKACQVGSIIMLYDSSKKDKGEYTDVKYLTQQSDGSLKEIDKESALKINAEENSAGLDTRQHKLNIQNYGGGLINLQNKEGKDIYLNTHNIAHSNTNNSKNMVKSNMVAKFKDSSRG